MTTPLTDEQIEAWAKEYGRIFLKRDGEGYQFPYTQECWVAWKGCARALLAQPSVAPPAPGGDVVAPKPTQERNENFVPGVMHCTKCRFRLNRINLNVNVGTVTAGDNKTEPCPNGCGPLWPITWEQEAREGYAALEAMFERAYAAEQALAARPSSPVLQLVASKSGTKQGQDAAPAEQPQAVELLDERGEIRRDLKSSAYCVGNEYKPFHPRASHVRPEWRDGWNACFVAAIAQERKA